MFEYKIPKEIKIKFTKDFMADFLINIIQVFNLNEPISYSDDIIYLASSRGWVDAFKNTCQKHNIKDVLAYYDGLKWYDSDLFDDELGQLLVEYGLIQKRL